MRFVLIAFLLASLNSYAKPNPSDTSINTKHLERKNFIKNELLVFLIPNDDVVLGKLTKKAYLAQMDMRKYIQLFNKHHNHIMNKSKRDKIKNFIIKFDSMESI